MDKENPFVLSQLLIFHLAQETEFDLIITKGIYLIQKGCSPPTAYLEDKNALGFKEMGEPALGHGV